nr:PAS domain S-box protein [Desulfobulbaceae bacterium]
VGSKDKLTYLRLMQPLYVKPECMKCHGHQGYKIGDIRGGVGISLPMYDILRHAYRQFKIHTTAFLILWALGGTVLFLGSKKLQKNTKELALSNIDLQREVEERKKADIALQKESSFTASVLNTAGALIMVIDNTGHIIRFNQTCEQVTGYSASEVSGQKFWKFLLSPEESLQMQNSFANINHGGLAMKRIGRLITKDNKRRIIDWANTTFRAQDGSIEYVISIGIDITEEKQLQEQLLHAEKLAAIGKLSASIAHEINNPLFGIRNVLERLKEKADLDHDNMEFAELAVQECDRIKNLIKDLQDFNRPTSGMFVPIDLHQSIDNMLLLLRKEFENKKITLSLNYAKSLPRINAISDQIKQVILNILNNAIEAIEEFGIITITTRQTDETVVIEISDTGSGIDDESMQHIFEPFFTTKTSVKGTGLGLSVTYGIVKNHGGSIAVSSLEKGTLFSISLPISGEKKHG